MSRLCGPLRLEVCVSQNALFDFFDAPTNFVLFRGKREKKTKSQKEEITKKEMNH